MKTKFTKGKWEKVSKKDETIIIRAGEKEIAAIAFSLKHSLSEWRANGNLIAAAPDLLKACENIMWAHSQLVEAGFHKEVDEIRAAIKKATE